jgi:uncharacterized protein DUF6788
MMNLLPKMLPGVLCQQWVRCGRAGCHCKRGKGHGPYWYRYWREGRRLRKVYVPRTQLPEVSACCEARRRQQQELRDSRQDLRALAQLLRDGERSR